MTIHLEELARQVRGHTIHLLDAAPAGALLWAPEGTSNHVLWHAGHALWLQDALCIEPLTGASELPPHWEETFGMDCRPVRETKVWPDQSVVRDLLSRQLTRLLEVFRASVESLGRVDRSVPGCPGEARRAIHAMHDEARHQGEMYLLLKLFRAGAA